MDEDGHVATEMPNSVYAQDSEKGVDQISSLNIKPEDGDFRTVLTELETLPFHDENQRTVFFENVFRLQDRHIIQIFRLGVVPLQTSTTESSEFLENVMRLFEICLSFCYTTDVSKRVTFEYYASALKFCFRPEPMCCLSTEVLSSLLELVQIFQTGNLATIVCDQKEQQPNPKYYLKGTKHFFGELLEVFERRREDIYISEIVSQTKRFASADAKACCIEKRSVLNTRLRSDHVVSPFFLTNWINLLKLANVSSIFASTLAKQDPLSHRKHYFPITDPYLDLCVIDFHKSDVCTILEILKEMKESGSELNLPVDEERLSVFFKHMDHIRQTGDATMSSLKLLATTTISTDVLRQVLHQFFEEGKVKTQNVRSSLEVKVTAFDHLLKVLTLLPDGRIVSKVLKLWRETSVCESNYYLHCKCFLDLFLEESTSADRCDLYEKAERTLNFLHWLPSYLLCFIAIWGPFLSHLIKAFPNSFEKRPEVLFFIHKAEVAARLSAEKRQETVSRFDQYSQFMAWISQQCFSEEVKSEMVWLVMWCTDGGSLAKNWTFSENIIKKVTLNQEMPFRKKAVIVRDVTRLAQLLQGQANMDFERFVENIISTHITEVDGEIFSEIFDCVKQFDDDEGPIKTIPMSNSLDILKRFVDVRGHMDGPMTVSQLLSLLSEIPISDVFLSILSRTSTVEVLLHWINQDLHHVCQCAEVILNACKQSLFTGDVAMEALLRFQGTVSAILERMRFDAAKDEPICSFLGCPVSCFRRLMPQLKSLSNLLEFKLSVDTKTAVLGIFQTNVQAGVAIGEVLSFFSCEQQALNLAKRFKRHCQEEMILISSAQEEFVWQSLKAFRRFCINSCDDVFARYERLNNLYDREDPYGFNRLPKWRQLMLTGGFSAQVIDWWCVAFLMTPLEDISSRDVDSIVNLNSGTLKLVESQLSETIQRCLFPTDGFRVSPEEGIKRQETKERLRLAKLLGEFINILKLLKPDENRKDAVIKEMLVCGCNKLCDAHENQARRNDLYIIQETQLKALITEVFGKQHKRNDDAENVCHTHKAVDEGSKGSPAFSRQSSCSNENLPLIMNRREVYQPLLVLVRRWLSQIAVKPNLASLTLKIVHLVFSVLSNEQGQELLLRVHSKINDRILSLEENEALMAQLQASGYNQSWQGHSDLWSSPKLECSGYISKVEAPDGRRYTRKLTQVLRQCWNQWKDVLSKLRIFHIKVGKSEVRTDDLFGLHESLEEMEQQVSAVNERVNQIQKNDEIIQQVIELMVRTEQRHRARIKTLYKGTKVREMTFFSPFMISFYGTQIGTRFTILGVIELIYVIQTLKSKHFKKKFQHM